MRLDPLSSKLSKSSLNFQDTNDRITIKASAFKLINIYFNLILVRNYNILKFFKHCNVFSF